MGLLLLHMFFVCINIGFFIVSGYSGQDLGGQPLPEYFDGDEPTGDFADILAPTNSTGDDSIIDGILKSGELANSLTYILINAVTGGFIIDTVENSVIEMPDRVVIGIKVIVGLLLAVQVFYWWTGRSSGKLS